MIPPDIDLEISIVEVKAKPRKLRAKWTVESWRNWVGALQLDPGDVVIDKDDKLGLVTGKDSSLDGGLIFVGPNGSLINRPLLMGRYLRKVGLNELLAMADRPEIEIIMKLKGIIDADQM